VLKTEEINKENKWEAESAKKPLNKRKLCLS
jgi:hypothetical protein